MGGPAEPGGTAPDLTRAHRYLRTALDAGQPPPVPGHHYRAGPGITALLDSLQAGPDLKPYLDELSVRAGAAAASATGTAGPPPGGLLSDRELEVLRLLASGSPPPRSPARCSYPPNTLKSHMKSIYRKLDVNSRADAAREGQALGLF